MIKVMEKPSQAVEKVGLSQALKKTDKSFL